MGKLAELHRTNNEDTSKRVFQISTNPCVAVPVDADTRELLKEHRYDMTVLDTEVCHLNLLTNETATTVQLDIPTVTYVLCNIICKAVVLILPYFAPPVHIL